MLPALLQGLDGIDAQLRCRAECLGLVDQGVATLGALFLRGFQTRGSGMDGGFPLRLQLGVSLFAQVARIAPALGKLVDVPRLRPPLGALGMGQGPGLDLFNQLQTLRFLRGGFLLELVQPGLQIIPA